MSEVPPSHQSGQQQNPPKRKSWLFVLLLLFAFCCAICTGVYLFGYMPLQKRMQFLEQSHQQLLIHSEQIKAAQLTVTDDWGELSQQVQSHETKINALNHHYQQLASASGQLWLETEVAFLLRAAQIQLVIHENEQSALTLLQAASELITQLPISTSLQAIHEKLHGYINDLSQRKYQSQQDTHAKWRALAKYLQSLPNRADLFNKQGLQTSRHLTEQGLSENEQQHSVVSRVKRLLSPYVSVRKPQDPSISLLDAEQLPRVTEHLQFLVQHAQMALSHQNSQLYQYNVERLQYWLETYLDPSLVYTKTALDRLEALSQPVIKDPLPDIASLVKQFAVYQANIDVSIEESTAISENQGADDGLTTENKSPSDAPVE